MSAIQAVLDLFARHRTIRNYEPLPLAEGDVDRIIEAARKAPSGVNAQIYSVIRVTDKALRDRLAELSGGQEHISVAAEFFVFCVDVHRTAILLESRGVRLDHGPHIAVHYGTMDVLLVAANMATAAEAFGYGTCFIGAILNHLDDAARVLNLPEGVMPVVGLTIGVPESTQTSPQKPRLPLDLVVHENGYREPTAEDILSAVETMGNRWLDSLVSFFGAGGRLGQRELVWLRTLAQQGFSFSPGANSND
jgi:FMN reductase (NADPH)